MPSPHSSAAAVLPERQRGQEVGAEHELDHEPDGQPRDERGDHGRDAAAQQQPGQHGEPERAQDVGGQDQALEVVDVVHGDAR